jgi:putative toxin-antitoxin system antitoxin component (TIGR02293 family)
MGTVLAKPKTKSIIAKVISRRKPGYADNKSTGGGVVRYLVHGPSGKATAQNFTPSKLIEALKAGLSVKELAELTNDLDLPIEKLVPMLGISKATLHRRKVSGKLDTAESDRVVRFARLLGRASVVMESPENGRRWLTAPQVGLGGEVPLVYAETEIGAREVEDLLGRIEYGVYS